MAEGVAIGKYRIVEELGSGGFATVFKAVDSTLGREVALKVLHPPLLVDKGFVERFFREARTLARLRHPNIVIIHEVSAAEGRVFLAMDLAASNLARAIAESGERPWPEVSAVIDPVAAALEYAHARGVVHRDLKPSNILIDDDGRPLLSDFGFARALGDTSASFSAGSGILGTPSYIAPELWDGKQAEAGSDIYALACIAHELRTGRVLFPGDTPLRAVAAHAAGPQLPEAWPPEVLEVFRRALARDPAERYRSAGAFAAALRAATEPRPEPAPSATATASAKEPRPEPAPAAPERVVRREPGAAGESTPRAAAQGDVVMAGDARAGDEWRPQQLATDRRAAGGARRPQQAAERPASAEKAAPEQAMERPARAEKAAPARVGAGRTLLASVIGAAGWAVFGLFIARYHKVGLERLLIDECAVLLMAAALAVGGISLSGKQLAAFALTGLLPSAFLAATQLGYFPVEWLFTFLPITGLPVAYSAGKAAHRLRWAVAVGVALCFLLTLALAGYSYDFVHHLIVAETDDYQLAHTLGMSAALPVHAFVALLLTFFAVAMARRRAAARESALRPDPSGGEARPQE